MQIRRDIKNIYNNEKTTKSHIILHHTAGRDSYGAIQTWLKRTDKVGAHFIIDRDGTVTQVVPEEYWCWSLGLDAGVWTHRRDWERKALAIELVAFGGLENRGGKWFTYTNNVIQEHEVELVDYRGYKAYQAYTQAQMDSLWELMWYLGQRHNIPIKTGGTAGFFDYRTDFERVSPESLYTQKTVFTHVNFRREKQKQDCYPSQRLIRLLSSFGGTDTQQPKPMQSGLGDFGLLLLALFLIGKSIYR